MTHKPAVDSLEQVVSDLTQPRTLSQFMGAHDMALALVEERAEIAGRLAALTRPAGGSERLRELIADWRDRASARYRAHAKRMSGADNWTDADTSLAIDCCADELEAALASPQGAEQRQEVHFHDLRHNLKTDVVDCMGCGEVISNPQAATQGDAQANYDLFSSNVRSALGAHYDADAGLICSIVLLTAEHDALRAALSSPPGVQAAQVSPKLIGWRTEDFLMETADKAVAQNWEPHYRILPIFEGDANTKLAGSAAHGGEDS